MKRQQLKMKNPVVVNITKKISVKIDKEGRVIEEKVTEMNKPKKKK